MSSSDGATASSGNRFAVINDDDHTGVLWVVSILCLIYLVMVFGLRLAARRKNFGFDDVLAIIGTGFATVYFILIFFANSHGLGKSYKLISTAEAETVGKFVHASQVCALLALGFAKCSVIFLCRRIFSSHVRSHRILCDVAMGVCATWSVASILTVALGCNPLQLLGYDDKFCFDLTGRWIAIGVLDSITEVAIVGMAFNGLWPLQMALSRKIQAITTFVLRLLIIAFAVLHITTLRSTYLSSNPGVAYTVPLVYLQVEVLYALITASVPALNRWLRNFDTSMGSTWMHNSSQQYSLGNSKSGEAGRSGSQSLQLRSLDNKRISRHSVLSRKTKRSSDVVKSGEFVPTGPKYNVTSEVFAPSPSRDSQERPTSTSMNSDDMIIRKDVHWHVQYEGDGSIRKDSN